MSIPDPEFIDGENYVRREIPTSDGMMAVEGLTVRALRKLLEKADPDDVVMYMAEQTEETRTKDLLLGVVAGAGIGSNCGATFLFGPEGVRAITEQKRNGN